MQIKNIYNVGVGGYNAYLVKGEKCALIDGVPREYSEELAKKLTDKIDYIIFNHASPVTGGALEKILEANPEAVVIGTISALKNIKEFVFREFKEQIAKDCQVLDLGGVTLEFHITPNVPWPDTMMTYAKEDKFVFTGEMFASDNGSAAEFFDAELHSFFGFVKKGIDLIKSLNAERICPSHGNEIINIAEALAEYDKKVEENIRGDYVAVCYMSKFGYTCEMARIIKDTLEKNGICVKMFDTEKGGADMQFALNHASAVVFGAPTINRNAPESVWKAVCGLDAVAQRGIPCMTFGAYGWSGDAPILIHTHLRAMNFRMFEKPFTSVFRMNDEEQKKLVKYSERFANFVKEFSEK